MVKVCPLLLSGKVAPPLLSRMHLPSFSNPWLSSDQSWRSSVEHVSGWPQCSKHPVRIFRQLSWKTIHSKVHHLRLLVQMDLSDYLHKMFGKWVAGEHQRLANSSLGLRCDQILLFRKALLANFVQMHPDCLAGNWVSKISVLCSLIWE